MKIDSAGNAGILVRAVRSSGNPVYQVRIRYQSSVVRTLLLVLVSFSVMCGGAFAHPPAEVAVSYDQNTGDIIVGITHPVDDLATHYVKEVTVMQGGIALLDKTYTSQPDRSLITYRYNLPQLKGSSGDILVNAQCSQFGSRSGSLTLSAVPASGSQNTAIPQSPIPTKSPVGLSVALVAICLVARQILK
ncbi:MAG: hypothetical protein WCH85_11590 [Methanomicrobiales archaeon]